jgi:hypothetical protein
MVVRADGYSGWGRRVGSWSGLAVVRRRSRLLGYWLLCFGPGICVLLGGACFIFGMSSIWLNRLRFYDFASFTDDFFHNLTDADMFLSFVLTLRLFDYLSIPLDPMT